MIKLIKQIYLAVAINILIISSTYAADSLDEVITPVLEYVINTLFFILGVVAVYFMIIGGLRIAASGGNSSTVESGKKTVSNALIGLALGLMAYGLVYFLLETLGFNI